MYVLSRTFIWRVVLGSVVCLVLVMAAAVAAAGSSAGGRSLVVVEDGQARAVVVVADDAEPQTRDAAELLVEYVDKSTGARLPLLTETELRRGGKNLNGRTRLYVGRNRVLDDDPEATQLLEALDGDGFVFWSAGNSLTIAGHTSWGTEFGVDEFLERYVGVRWLLPGHDGEDVPQTSDLAVPRELVREEPAALQRTFTPLVNPGGQGGPVQHEWARRNRFKDLGPARDQMSFHHNLSQVLPPAKYFDEHPEWYPGGEFPSRGWQPCFTAEGTVDAAVAEVIDFFDENPDVPSFSLGVNDGGDGTYCESDPDHPDYPGQDDSGRLAMSDIYYGWVNEVVEGVLHEHPDKSFGLLAYNAVRMPPSFALHPRVVPFMTDDRMSWAYPAAGEHGRQMTEDWAQVATRLGWYEYLYGGPYAVPRVYFHQMAENYRFGASRGVTYHFAELFPNWGEGPKAWLSAKLQWDPVQDVDALLTEWYERAVGPAAAPDLAEYYKHWERFWTERVFSSQWFTRWWTGEPRRNFMNFYAHNYLDLVTDEEIADSRELLESVVAKAETGPQQARAELLLRNFEYYEAAALSYPSPVPVQTPTDEARAIALIERAARHLESADRRDQLADEFAADPIRPTRSMVNSGLSGAALDSHVFWSLADWMAREEPTEGPVRQRVQDLAQEHESATVRGYARLLLTVVDDEPPLTANSSFEEGDTDAPPWGLWLADEGTLRRSSDEAATGNFSLLAEGIAPRGGPTQRVPVSEGTYGAVASFLAPEDTESDGTVRFFLNLFDADGQQIGTLHGGVWEPGGRWGQRFDTRRGTPVLPTKGRWSTTEAVFQIPSGVTEVSVGVAVENLAPDDRVYLDDVSMYRLD